MASRALESARRRPGRRHEELEDLRAKALSYRRFIELTNEGIWCFRFDPPIPLGLGQDEEIELYYERGRMVECNDALARMYGYSSADELIGMPLASFVVPSKPENIEYMRSFIRSNRLLTDGESVEKDRDGNTRYFLNNLIGRTEGETLLEVWGTQRDITDSKQLEAQLRHAQKMEAMGRLAGSVAHDFNNLLTVWLWNIESLLKRVSTEEELARELEEMRDAGERAANLTSKLLLFSRRQIGHPRPTDLNKLVGSMYGMLARLVGETVDLELRTEPELPAVLADEAQLEQVVLNLAVNARDAMPDGGSIVVETRRASPNEARGLPDGVPGVVLRVIDHGCGMDEATLSRALEPFFTTKPPGEGTGLGLSTAYGIVKQSHGTLSIESEPGRGTVASVVLPGTQLGVHTRAARTEGRASASGSETILLVEDDQQIRRLAKDALVEAGYKVLETSAGDVALRVAQQHEGPIHLLVSDVVMPRMGGPALARALADSRPSLKLLFISGYPDAPDEITELVGAGAGFLAKPFVSHTFIEKVRALLDRG